MPNNLKNILNEYVQGLLQIIGEDLVKVILYGSYARGEQSANNETSDIDIMILIKSNNIKEIQEKIIDYSYDLDLKYDILLSPIVENIEVFNNRTKYMPFYKNVMKEGVSLNG